MKKPFAYISAAWSGQEFTDTDQAVVYCRKVYQAGFTPICPVLYLPHFLNDSIPAEHKDGIDMARELLRRSHVLIVCGDEVDEAVKNDIAVAQRLGITATTLDGILKIRSQGHEEARCVLSPATAFPAAPAGGAALVSCFPFPPCRKGG